MVQITISTGSITDSDGAISFGDENLSTSGTLASGSHTVTGNTSISGAVSAGGDVTPVSSNGSALGSATSEWSDLYMADGSVILLGDDQDVTLTHVADAGVLINDDKQLQFRDNEIKINSSADGQLDIDANTEVEITTTTLDINGAVDASGDVTVGTSLRTGTIDYTDGTLALTVAANGNLTTSGNLSIGGTLSGDGSGLTGVSAGAIAADDLNQGDAAVTISTSTGAINITPASGSAIVLDGAVNVDAGIVTGATSITTQTQVASTSVQTPLIEYTDGDDAMTIANGGGVTFAQAASLPTGTTIGDLTLSNGSIVSSSDAITFGNDALSTTGTLSAGVATLATGSTVGNLTLANGSITDSGGAIDFGNENLSTTGTLSAGVATLATGSTVGNLTLANGSITDSGGSISFGNENVSTTGTLSAGVATLATGSTVGNLTLANGSITDSGGAIDFGNENLTTTGTLSAEQLTTTDDLTVTDEATIDGTMTISTGSITDSGGTISFSNENLTTTGTITANSFTGDGSGLTGVSAGSIASDNLTQGDAAVTLSTSSGAVNITPGGGSAIVLDGAINVDAGIVTGATSITSVTQIASTSVQTPLIEYTDGDDAMTIANGGGVTFSQAATLATGSTVGNLTLANGSITDVSGAIDFGNENVSTTGTLSAGAATLATGSTVGNLTLANGSITDSGGAISFWNENVSTTGTLGAGVATLATGSTVGNLTLANGSITDSGGAIDFGNENLSTSGTISGGTQSASTSVQTPLIEYTDGDDAMTIANGGGVTFAQAATLATGSTVGNLTLANGSITDSGGAISFGNENVSTTGTLGAGVATLATGSTVGNLTLANGSITDSGGAIDFGAENLSTSGNMTVTTSLQTTTIDYTDGTLALTIGSNGAITSSADATVTGDLTVSGNDIKDNGGSAAITFDGSSNITTGGTLSTGGAITSAGAVIPSSANASALGSASKEWSDAFFGDGAVISLGNDDDVLLTHVADAGVKLNSTRQIQFGDAGTYLHQSADGVLDLVADGEVEINGGAIDINGTTSLENATIDFVKIDGTYIGHTDDTDLMNLSSGTVTVLGTVAATAVTGDGSGLTGVSAGSIASDNLTQGDAAVTLSTSSGAVNITPGGGSAIVLDGAINVDAGIVTGATSITSVTQVASTSVQTPLIEYTDGDDAMTIANGGGVTFSQAATLATGSTVETLR